MNEHLSTIEPASASDLPPGLDIPGAEAVYADGAVPPRPANRRGAGPPAEAQVHFRVHAQRGLAGVLDTIAGAGRLLGHPFALVCLLRDAGTDAWYTTALLDMDGRPLDFARMQVPAGPYLFEAPAGFAMQPLVETLAAAWGVPACTALAERVGAPLALTMPIPGSAEPHGALLALTASVEDGLGPIAGILAHAATAMARHLDRDRSTGSDDVLDETDFARRAGDEVARAERHERSLTLVSMQAAGAAELARLTAALKRSLRRGDFVGRPDPRRAVVVAVLPECNAMGWRGVAGIVEAVAAGYPVGAASFPDDGRSLRTLLEVADQRRERAASGTPRALAAQPAEQTSQTWRRGGRATADEDTVQCPTCSATYGRVAGPGETWRMVAAARVAAEAHLRRVCPDHQDAIETGGARGGPHTGAVASAALARDSAPAVRATAPGARRSPRVWSTGQDAVRPPPVPPSIETPRPAAAVRVPATAEPPAAMARRSVTPEASTGAVDRPPGSATSVERLWSRGRSGRGNEDVAFCPRCMVGYARQPAANERPEETDAARAAAAARLRQDCPGHDESFTVVDP